MALEFAATIMVLAGHDGQGGPLVTSLGPGSSSALTGQALGQGTSDIRASSPPAVDAQAQNTGQWSLASRGLARRDWVGRCVHCSRGLVVTVKASPNGADICRVSPYDSHWTRPRSRSRSRSPPPVISPVRSRGDEMGRQTVSHLPGQSTLIDEDEALGDSMLPFGQDTRLLEFF